MKRKHVPIIVSAALAAILTFVGAGGCDEAEEFFDCEDVCVRYRDCFDSAYNVDACRDRCEARADADDRIEEAADACEQCIGVNSCLSATFNCPVCANIVP